MVFEALLSNPEPEQMHFEVVFQGDGLQGETNFYIPPESTKTYELLYLPLKASNQQGFLSFMNNKMGEIWYDLHLVANA